MDEDDDSGSDVGVEESVKDELRGRRKHARGVDDADVKVHWCASHSQGRHIPE